MAQRFDFYFKQVVTEGEIDGAFAGLELADRNIITDLGLSGIASGGLVVEHSPVPDITVDIAGPMSAHSPQGERLFFSPLQNVDVSVDDLAVSTAVGSGGNEKIVSVFLKFDRLLSDDRVDGGGNPIKFQQDESFKFVVKQGTEATAGSAVPPPLESDGILFVDITRTFGQTQIFNANLDFSRRQDLALKNALEPTEDHAGITLSAAQFLQIGQGRWIMASALVSGAGSLVGTHHVNIASVSKLSSVYTITFDQPFPDANYIATATIDDPTLGAIKIGTRTATTIDIETFTTVGVPVDRGFSLHITGRP